MTLTKALSNLKAGRKDCGMIPEGEFTATIDLAIEAVKWVARYRPPNKGDNQGLLPGETEG